MPVEVLPEMTIVWPKEWEMFAVKPVKVVYVAGAFRASTQWGIMQNVRKAEDASLKLWKFGYAVICPHTMTQHFQDECPDEVWLGGCLALLSRCDAIYILSNYKQSIGTLQELELAKKLGLLIMYEDAPDKH